MRILHALKRIWASRVFKILFILCGALLAFLIIFTISFATKCGSTQLNFKPIHEEINESVRRVEDSIPKYSRTEETTYITYPEWYLVFNPQEYARFLEHGRPSRFPYFASIGQFWGGYCEVYGITKRNYPFNAGNHLVEAVIGVSFTGEFIVKGVYENTVGWFSEILARGQQTEEDIYAAKIAREYGEFIPTQPWYAYPFGRAFRGLWTETGLWGPHVVRKWERKFFLSLEYGVKTVYAKLIGFGTHATFGIADSEIYAHVKKVPDTLFADPKIKKIKVLDDGSQIVTVPHYQGFTDTVPNFAKAGVEFYDLAGNDEILMTVVAPAEWKYNLVGGAELFTMPILTDRSKKRVAVQAPVAQLSEMLNNLSAQNIQIEHLFDY